MNKQKKVFTYCASELWILLLKDVIHAKRFAQVQSNEKNPKIVKHGDKTSR